MWGLNGTRSSYTSTPENDKKPVPVEPSWTGEPRVQLTRAWKGTRSSNEKPTPVEPSCLVELGGTRSSVSLTSSKLLDWECVDVGLERNSKFREFDVSKIVEPSWTGEPRVQLTRGWKGTRSSYTSALENKEKPAPVEPSCPVELGENNKNPHQLARVGQANQEFS
ncbi:hypothetical protein K438DRAFT_1763947 [Mycena galopus ATCC 62051]|nr:hypothetical protein K438DRAFT_1789717 [Mycena galopus ATCC 62051]KAF8189204.1 hypothetical protein K438DRAFT_1763947 [Mycena galopus ATCC 62051]